MDAVKFIEERNRMCMSFCGGCEGCPAFDGRLCALDWSSTLDAAAQIAIVEEWSAAHPQHQGSYPNSQRRQGDAGTN